jgi:hypothetical protein
MLHRRKTLAATPTPPVISGITFDKTSYNPGDVITATVTYVPGSSSSVQNLTGTATDSVSGATGTLQVTFTVVTKDTTTVSVSDTGSRIWTKKSDTGTVAVFTATA